MSSTRRNIALLIAGAYAIAGALWILTSDTLASMLLPPRVLGLDVQTIKGWFYILVTAILLYVATARALAIQARTAEKLERSETQWAAVLNAAPGGVLLLRDRVVVAVNEHVEAMTGYRSDELIGQSARVLYADDEAYEAAGDDLYHGMCADGTGRRKGAMRCKDGSLRTTITHLRPLDPNRPGEGHVATFMDVTEQDEAQEALRASQAFAAGLLTAAPVGVVAIKDRVVTLVNDHFCRLLGRSSEELVGGSTEIFYPSHEEYLRVGGAIQEQLLTSGRAELECTLQCADGGTVAALLGGGPIDVSDPSAGIVGTVVDITERKREEAEKRRLEAQAQRAQRLESLGVLAGGIAHDFNNLLAVILGYAEMATLTLPEDSRERANLQEVLAAGARGRDMVRQMMALGKQSERQLQPVDLVAAVEEAAGFLRSSIPTTIKMVVDLPDDDCVVMADPTNLHQVITNLGANAQHAMEEEGLLSIALEMQDVDPARASQLGDIEPGRYACIAVADTGCGMDEELKERIFDPFFTTKGPGEGTGLGLAMVHGIVRALSGGVHVYSEVGEGTTFRVYIPCSVDEPAKPQQVTESAPIGAERVLLVDDEEAVLRLGEQILVSLGYSVAPFLSGPEALAAFEADPDSFDMLVTDETMPDMRGTELSRAVHAIKPDLPALVVTGRSDELDPELLREAGVGEVVAKPYARQELAEAMRRQLDAQH